MSVVPGIIFSFLLMTMVSSASFAQHAVKQSVMDTAGLLSHRWLVTATEKSGKKTVSEKGSMALYMNFFSNGGFDFVALGDGDFLIWKYRKGSVGIYHKAYPDGAPEADFKIEKINAKNLVIAGTQNGVAVRYFLSHQPGE